MPEDQSKSKQVRSMQEVDPKAETTTGETLLP